MKPRYNFKFLVVIPILVAVLIFFSEGTSGAKRTNQLAAVGNVNEEILNALKTYKKSSDKITAEQDLITVATARQARLRNLAETSPEEFIESVLTENVRRDLPPTAQPFIERPFVGSGKLINYVIEGETSADHEYWFMAGQKTQRLFLTEEIDLMSNSTINISGYELGDSLIVDVNQGLTIVSAAGVDEVVDDPRVAVALVDFLDSGPREFTAAQIEQMAFDGQPQAYYQDQSYGEISLTGDVYDWYQLNRNGPAGAACPSVPEISNPAELEEIVLGSGIDLGNYDHLIIFVSHPCIERGISTQGQRPLLINGQIYLVSVGAIGEAWQYDESTARGTQPFPWTNFDHLFSHELGHGLGLQHSKGYDCGEKSFYQFHPSECTEIEYGNHFDLMARANFTLGLNAFHRELLGWISEDENEIIDIRESGRYTIGAINRDSAVKAAKINLPPPGSSGPNDFYIEHRKGSGFDRNLNRSDLSSNIQGLLINHIARPNAFRDYPRLLDMLPTALAWDDDLKSAVLMRNSAQRVFIDQTSDIAIGPIISSTLTDITFDVGIGENQCFRAEPILGDNLVLGVDVDARTFYLSPGQSKRFTVEVINNDYFGCGPSDFTLAFDWPPNWQIIPTPSYSTANLFPQEPQKIMMYITVPARTRVGTYNFPLTLTSAISGLSTVEQFRVVVM